MSAKKPAVSYGVYLGTPKESIQEMRGAINDILKAPHVDNKTKIAALKVLGDGCSIEGVSISNCNVNQA